MEYEPTHAGMRVLKHLAGVPPRTISELAEELGVTRTAVTEQLNELVSAGCVLRVQEHSKQRGRPQYRYELMPQAVCRFFPENQHLLVPAVWKAIQKIGGTTLLRDVILQTAENLSAECRKNLPWTERVEMLVQQGGFESYEFQPDGSAILTKRTCRFFSMYETSETVCEIHIQTLAQILGVCVSRIASRHEDAPCCRFLAQKEERTEKFHHKDSENFHISSNFQSTYTEPNFIHVKEVEKNFISPKETEKQFIFQKETGANSISKKETEKQSIFQKETGKFFTPSKMDLNCTPRKEEELKKDIFLFETSPADETGPKVFTQAEHHLAEGQRLILKRDLRNPYDESAIQILDQHGQKIGILPRKQNEIPARLMDEGKVLYAILTLKEAEGKQRFFIRVFMEE